MRESELLPANGGDLSIFTTRSTKKIKKRTRAGPRSGNLSRDAHIYNSMLLETKLYYQTEIWLYIETINRVYGIDWVFQYDDTQRTSI